MKKFAVIEGGLGGSALGLASLGFTHLWGCSRDGADGAVYSNLLSAGRRFAPVYVMPHGDYGSFWSSLSLSLRPDLLVAHVKADSSECIISALEELKPSRVIVIADSRLHGSDELKAIKRAMLLGYYVDSQKIKPRAYKVPCNANFSITRAIAKHDGGLRPIRAGAYTAKRANSVDIRRFVASRDVQTGERMSSVEQFMAAQTFPLDKVDRLTAEQKRHVKAVIRGEFPPSIMRVITESFHADTIGGTLSSWR